MPRGKKKGLSTKKFDRCVSKVRSKSGKKANPYAVCNASMGGKSKSRKKWGTITDNLSEFFFLILYDECWPQRRWAGSILISLYKRIRIK